MSQPKELLESGECSAESGIGAALLAEYRTLQGREAAEFFEKHEAALWEAAEAEDAKAPAAAKATPLFDQYQKLMRNGEAREAADFWEKHRAEMEAEVAASDL